MGFHFPQVKKIRKGHTTEIDTWGCRVSVFETRSIDWLEINSTKAEVNLKITNSKTLSILL